MNRIEPTAYTLLWFRPISPLAYTLPNALGQLPWAITQHIPIDVLQPCAVSSADLATLRSTPTWVLSSPTAAYIAAQLGRPSSIAVMGEPTQLAWRTAGGAEPAQWLVSPSGESMGLLNDLMESAKVCLLRGRQGRNDLMNALQAADVAVSAVPMYEKTQHPHFVTHLHEALQKAPIALYLSSTDQVARLYAAAQDKTALLSAPVMTSHERIAHAARTLGFENVIHTMDP